MKRCRHCGTTAEDDARFCAYCGKEFDGQYNEYSAESQEPPKESLEGQYQFSGDAPPLPSAPGTYKSYSEPQAKPSNNGLVWLILSIIMTVCCCSPFQIASIIISAISVSKYNQGDFEESKRLSKIAMIVFFSLLGLSIISKILVYTSGWYDPGFIEDFVEEWY